MIEVGRVTGALVERIADHSALRRPRGHVEHELVAAAKEFVIEGLIADAWLDHDEGKFLVDVENAIHLAAEIDHDLAGGGRRARAKPDIVAGRNRIERDLVGVRRAHDQLHVAGRGRVDDASGRAIAARHRVLAVTADRLFRAIDAVGAERTGNGGEKRFEIRRCHGSPLFTPFSLPHQMPVGLGSAATGALVASSCAAGARRTAGSRKRVAVSAGGIGPPVAQSNSSTVCTIGAWAKRPICTMQPRLPAAMMSGSTLAICAALRSPSAVAISGCSRL